MDEYWLTTIDNPYNPFTEFEDWWFCDEHTLGHHTSGLLARMSDTNSDNVAFDRYSVLETMKRIVANDLLGIYVIVTRKANEYNTKEN